MKFCDECFSELQKHNKNKCDECLSVKQAKKEESKIKRKLDGTATEMFLPENEGKTWFKVPSPYKAYKE